MVSRAATGQGWKGRSESRGRGGKGEEAAVTSVPGPEEASSACSQSPSGWSASTPPDLASEHLTPSFPAPYL